MGRRKSKYRYFKRTSSKASVWSSITNGGNSALDNNSNSSNKISMSPLGIFLLMFLRTLTVPVIVTTDSLVRWMMLLKNLLFSFTTTCTKP
jgi:hypothetical protein